MRVLPTRLDGSVLLEPAVHADAGGVVLECDRASGWALLGGGVAVVKDNE
jgi:hypothetical protein